MDREEDDEGLAPPSSNEIARYAKYIAHCAWGRFRMKTGPGSRSSFVAEDGVESLLIRLANGAVGVIRRAWTPPKFVFIGDFDQKPNKGTFWATQIRKKRY